MIFFNNVHNFWNIAETRSAYTLTAGFLTNSFLYWTVRTSAS